MIAAIAADVTTTVALIVAGIWTYLLFVKNRERYPRATIEQVASPLKLDDQLMLVRVQIRVSNIGKVLLPIEDLKCRLQQLLPVEEPVKAKAQAGDSLVIGPASDVDWPMLSEATWRYRKDQSEIEPGEAEVFSCDFAIDRSVRCVRVYSHLVNQAKKSPVGWACTTDLDLLQGAPGGKSSAS